MTNNAINPNLLSSLYQSQAVPSLQLTQIDGYDPLPEFTDSSGVRWRLVKAANSGMSPEELMDSFPLITWMVKHAVLTDTLSDTFVNVLLFVLIWLRVKKMEH